MSAELVNLRRVRKARLRAEKDRASAANRVLHGRTRVERDAQHLERDRAGRSLDGHLLAATPEARTEDGDPT